MLQLVCEGACNPNLAEYDKAAWCLAQSKWNMARMEKTTRSPMPVDFAELNRSLVHTPHVTIAASVGDTASVVRCTVCGRERDW